MALSANPDRAAPEPAGPEQGSSEELFTKELRLASASGVRVPDFFIVGHAKCGTTALYRMLEQHPQIYLSDVKEPQFLARAPDERAPMHGSTRRGTGKRPQTLEAYLQLFAEAGTEQVAGEGSPQYIRSPTAARRIAALCPDARIVAIFREPASFLRSIHLQLLEANIETERDFAKALALESERRRGKQIPRDCRAPDRLLYSDHVRYVDQLRRYHERFGRARVLALIYDDFRADNQAVIGEVLRFLNVDDSFEIRAVEANPTVQRRSERVHELIHATALGTGPILRAVKLALKATTPARFRRQAVRTIDRSVVDHRPRPADPRLMDELRLRFRGEVEAASEYLQRDLIALWHYDELGERAPPMSAGEGPRG
jgi:hypothetical protein